MECARQGCRNEVTPRRRGRPPRFCSDTCRKADQRRRRRQSTTTEWTSALTGAGGEAAMLPATKDPDVQVVAVVHETIMLRNTYERLGRDARPELAVRCECMAKVIGDGLMDHFRGAVGDE